MKININNIKFNFKLCYRGEEGLYGIAAYFNQDIQLYELIDEDGKLLTNHKRLLNMNEPKILDLRQWYDLRDSEIKAIIQLFDDQASMFLGKNKFLQKPNFIVRYKKKDVLHDVELEIINERMQTGEYVRDLISKGYDYEWQNKKAKDTIKCRTPYLIMSYEETISRNEYDPWDFIITGKTYYTLFDFIVSRPDRWEYNNGNLYIPEYKFLEQVGLFHVAFHLESGVKDDIYFNELNNIEYRELFKEHLISQNIISQEKFTFTHQYMQNCNGINQSTICLNLLNFKKLISSKIAKLSFIEEYENDVLKFNFIADAQIKGYSDKIPAYFLDKKALDTFININSKLSK